MLADRLRPLCLPAVAFTTSAAPDEAFAPGASRLGGRPDLPPDLPAWPTARRARKSRFATLRPAREELPLAFLGQIALDDVSPLDVEGLLPRGGHLAFFALDDVRLNRAIGATDDAPDRTRVLYVPAGAPVVPRDPPAALPPECVGASRRPAFAATTTWPQIEGNALSRADAPVDGTLVLSREEWEAWGADAPANPVLQLLGHPAGAEHPIGRDPDRRLLLSLEAEASGLPWGLFGRNGFVFFHLPEAALRAGDWSAVRHTEW